MPELQLTPEMVGAGRTRLVLGEIIEPGMLWPNDAARRATAAAAARAKHVEESIPADDHPVVLRGFDLRVLVENLASAPPLADIQDSARQPFCRGVLAGTIFLETLHARKTGRNRNLQQIKLDATRRFSAHPAFQRLSASTVENSIWKVYRPVSHLWAASIYGAVADGEPFPCSVSNLPQFLSFAEALRADGVTCQLGQGGTLLDPIRTWSVPAAVPLPPTQVSWDASWRPSSNAD
jgi:hypothetical protein